MKKNSYSTIEESMLLRYLEGKLHGDDRMRVEEWYSESEENAKLLERIYVANALGKGARAASLIDVEKAYADFDSRLRLKRRNALDKKLKRIWLYWAVIAALTLFIVRTGSADKVRIATGIADTTAITLRDGSTIYLNGVLIYAKPSFYRPKTLTLKGEARFDIVAKKVVRTDGMSISATGARFAVNATGDPETVTLSVMEGMVRVTFDDRHLKHVMLLPDQRLIYDTRTSIVWVEDIDRQSFPIIDY